MLLWLSGCFRFFCFADAVVPLGASQEPQLAHYWSHGRRLETVFVGVAVDLSCLNQSLTMRFVSLVGQPLASSASVLSEGLMWSNALLKSMFSMNPAFVLRHYVAFLCCNLFSCFYVPLQVFLFIS